MTIENKKDAESSAYDEAYFERRASREEIYLEETEEELRAKLLSVATDSSKSSEQDS